MSQIRRNLLLSFAVTIMMLVVLPNLQKSADAQTDASPPHTISNLIHALDQRTKDESGFLINFKFVTPLIEGETNWQIPFSDTTQHLYRSIDIIENDYLCFREKAGGADFERCTPFSNIAQISYLNN